MQALTDLFMQQLFGYGLAGVAHVPILLTQAAQHGTDFGKLSPTFFNDLLQQVIKAAQGNATALLQDGFRLLNILLVIRLVWKCLQLALKQAGIGELIGELFELIWLWGIAAWFLHSADDYKMLTDAINKGFDYIGYKLVTGQAPNVNDPSYMVNMLTVGEGVILGAINDIWQHMRQLFFDSNAPAILELLDGILNVFTVIMLLFAAMYYFIVFASSQVLVFISLSLGPIFIPWLVTPATKQYFFGWLRFTIVAGMYKVMGMLIATFGGELLKWLDGRIKGAVNTADMKTNAVPTQQGIPCTPIDGQTPPGCDINAPDPTQVQGDLFLSVVKNDLAYIVVAMLLAWMMQQVPGWANGILRGNARVSGDPRGQWHKATRTAGKALRLATKALAPSTGAGAAEAAADLMSGGAKKALKSAAGRGAQALVQKAGYADQMMGYAAINSADKLMERFADWRQRAQQGGAGGGGTAGGSPGTGAGSTGPNTPSGSGGAPQSSGNQAAGESVSPTFDQRMSAMAAGDASANQAADENEQPTHDQNMTAIAAGDATANQAADESASPTHGQNMTTMAAGGAAGTQAAGGGAAQRHDQNMTSMAAGGNVTPSAPANGTTPGATGTGGPDSGAAAANATAPAAGAGEAGQTAAPPETEYRGGKPFKTADMYPGGTVDGYQTITVDGPQRRLGPQLRMTYWPDGTARSAEINGWEGKFEAGLHRLHPKDRALVEGTQFVSNTGEYEKQARERGYDPATGKPIDHPVTSLSDPENGPGKPGNVGLRQFDNVREGPDHPQYGQTWITREGPMSFQRTWDGKAVSSWLTAHPEISGKDVPKALSNPKEFGLNMQKLDRDKARNLLNAEKKYKAPPASALPPKPAWELRKLPPAVARQSFRHGMQVNARGMAKMKPARPAAVGNYRAAGKNSYQKKLSEMSAKRADMARQARATGPAFRHTMISNARGLAKARPPASAAKVNYSGNGRKAWEKSVRQMTRPPKPAGQQAAGQQGRQANVVKPQREPLTPGSRSIGAEQKREAWMKNMNRDKK